MKKRVLYSTLVCMSLTCILNFESFASNGTLSNINYSNSSNGSNTSNSSNSSNTSNSSNLSNTYNLNISAINNSNSSDRTNVVNFSNTSNTSNTSNSTEKTKETSINKVDIDKLDKVMRDALTLVNKGAKDIKAYKYSVEIFGDYNGEGDFSIEKTDIRVYNDSKLIKSAISIINEAKKEKKAENYYFENGILYKYDGDKYKYMGKVDENSLVEVSDYWCYLNPLIKRPDLFSKNDYNDDLVVTYNGNDGEIYDEIRKLFNIDETGNLKNLDIMYSFDSETGILKEVNIIIQEDLLKLNITGTFSKVNEFNDFNINAEVVE